MNGWIGVDLDGTLAEYHEWIDPLHIGKPIPLMTARVRQWLLEGKDVRIFTARVNEEALGKVGSVGEVIQIISDWCLKHVGKRLPITYKKDYGMIELWDDRAVQVIPNTGQRADGKQ